MLRISEASKTIVVSGVPDVLTPSRMADKLIIHFQSSRSHGGDVEKVEYPTNFKGVGFVTFEKNTDAEKVITKEQIMRDKEFPQDYHLTVYKFTPDVFFYVNADLDLSMFGEDEQQREAIQNLQAVHRSVRIGPLVMPGQWRGGTVKVEGPFTALKALRQDLLQRAGGSNSHTGIVLPMVQNDF
ncbi:hypothetical protein UPYG_G00018040 [Umbra pygmaea]|uniref:RRM domain-containing protein n=1 Tax=Umbra pygmaea TaxID=75934 RepID=A0ABD0XK31_UMBPY